MRSHSANDESDQTIYLSAPSDQIVSLLVKVRKRTMRVQKRDFDRTEGALDQLDNTITQYGDVNHY